MADENDLPIPQDIPWQLLSRRGPESVEDPTSLATFVHVPSLPELDTTYPDDRIVYFKFSASVFPFYLNVPRVPPLTVLETFAPVWRMVLDIEITRREATAGLKPYFLSAAPTRRAIVETGVVGDHLLEGESDEVAIGKSASHLIEGFHSTTKTRKLGVGGAIGGLFHGFPFGIGASYSRGTTSISGGREASEQVDTTNRQASEERKELLSHMTNVNNVLTLLNGSLVGTNRLRFSLWPQPLRPLSVDPADENLWYAELLKRRSSGIEGMQDFFAVAVIPRGEGFCLLETLRRVSVVEPPMPRPPVQPLVIFDAFNFNLNDFVKVFSYVAGKYPEGTPLEELDVSIEDRLLPNPAVLPPFPSPSQRTRANLQAWYNAVSARWTPNPFDPLPPFNALIETVQLNQWAAKVLSQLTTPPTGVKIQPVPRPIVSGWTFSNSLPPTSNFILHPLTDPPTLPVPYKWVQDVWLEAVQYEYETELARSPLERGALLIEDRRVDICADLDEEGAIGEVTTTIPPPPGIGVLPPLPSGTLIVRPWDPTTSSDPRTKGRTMVSAWAAAEAQLATRLAGAATTVGSLSFQDPRIVEILLRHAKRLEAGDRRNVPLAELSRRFGFAAGDVQQLKAGGVTNLSSLASSILATQLIARFAHVQPFVRDERREQAAVLKTLPPRVAQSVVRAIGVTLDALWQKHEQAAARRPQRTHRHTRRRIKRSSRH